MENKLYVYINMNRSGYNRLGGLSLYPFRSAVSSFIANTGIVPNFKGVMDGEQHLPFCNYAGPGTRLDVRLPRGDVGTTPADAAAKIHDIEYRGIKQDWHSGKISKAEAERRVVASDNKLLKNAAKSVAQAPTSLLNQVHASGIVSGIAAKKLGENLNIIDRTTFVGKPKEDPARILRKMAQSVQKVMVSKQGGFVAPHYKIPSTRPVKLPPNVRPEITIPQPPIKPPIRLPIHYMGRGSKPLPFDIDEKALKAYLMTLPVEILKRMTELQRQGGLIPAIRQAQALIKKMR
jgi:hypothetical protein